jgi:excinuclease ABC subunit A
LITFPLEKLLDYFKNLDLTENQRSISGQLLEEIIRRISLLVDIGLEYITLDRLSHTLSGGESQRINLSTALGSSLVGTLYVLDEPSIGLHQRDTDRLISILIKLRNLGNTVVVVEHDLDIIKKADNIIDMGPKAGEKGGELVFSGKFEEISKAPESLTGKYFSGEKKIEIPQLRNPGNGKAIKIFGPAANNLKMPEVTIPLGCINVITGVSGSGKSSLIHDVLYAGLKNSREEGQGIAGRFEMITGGDNIEYVEMVDQSPIGKSSRSTPATYTKAFDHIREVFAQTQLARQFGWKPGYFSFNVPGGRCDVCDGEGSVTVDMQFLPDLHLECEACKGTRYKKELRNILFKGKSIVDVLDMTIDEAIEFFKGIPKVTNKLNILSEVGLGYLKLGQPSSMLSGGESQRVKLANHLDSSSPVRTMFIFDEPTTGLHIDDISRLIDCFRKLISGGHSVVIIEHNLHIISSADWIIDLGPGAGENGGEIIAMGTPEKVARDKNSFTGKALKEFFESI